jgi:hypothetical protein
VMPPWAVTDDLYEEVRSAGPGAVCEDALVDDVSAGFHRGDGLFGASRNAFGTRGGGDRDDVLAGGTVVVEDATLVIGSPELEESSLEIVLTRALKEAAESSKIERRVVRTLGESAEVRGGEAISVGHLAHGHRVHAPPS